MNLGDPYCSSAQEVLTNKYKKQGGQKGNKEVRSGILLLKLGNANGGKASG